MVLSTTPAYASEPLLWASIHRTVHLEKDEAWISEQMAKPEPVEVLMGAVPVLEISDGSEEMIATATDLTSTTEEEQASADEPTLDEAPTVTAEPMVEAEAPVPDEIEGEPQ